MSDSSSVDRWHPSNVEWPDAYIELYADRGRVLAAARELAEAVEEMMNASAEDDQGARIGDAADRLDAALASFREVDQ